MTTLRVLIWHLHGSYMTSLLQGRHTYFLPTSPERGPFGRGRAETWEWPASAVELTAPGDVDVDVVVLQRPEELELAQVWLGGRRPGVDVPAIYLEHNAPQGRIAEMRHPVADRPGISIVHVTQFNRLFWDTGGSPVRVIEHGIPDLGERYRGEIDHAAVVVNEPVRRGRVTGTDLLPVLVERSGVDIDLFGMRSEQIGGTDLPQNELHQQIARRRFYLHPVRWTSLGLSLIEAMLLGMPVVAFATTEVVTTVPSDAGFVSNDLDEIVDAMRWLADDEEEARMRGKAARIAALSRFGIDRFLREWDATLQEAVDASI